MYEMAHQSTHNDWKLHFLKFFLLNMCMISEARPCYLIIRATRKSCSSYQRLNERWIRFDSCTDCCSSRCASWAPASLRRRVLAADASLLARWALQAPPTGPRRTPAVLHLQALQWRSQGTDGELPLSPTLFLQVSAQASQSKSEPPSWLMTRVSPVVAGIFLLSIVPLPSLMFYTPQFVILSMQCKHVHKERCGMLHCFPQSVSMELISSNVQAFNLIDTCRRDALLLVTQPSP